MKREKIVLLISILSGLLASALIYISIKGVELNRNDKDKFEWIITVKSDLTQGKTINGENLSYIKIPSKYVTSTVIRRGDEKFIKGAVAKYLLEKDKPIRINDIIPFGGKEYYISKLSSKYYPYTLFLNKYNQIPVELKKGDRVDLYILRNETLIPIAGNVKVIWIESYGLGKAELTLSLKKKQLYRLTIGKSKGMIWINRNRDGEVPTSVINWSQLIDKGKRKKVSRVEILRIK